jgi:hypothetical protein
MLFSNWMPASGGMTNYEPSCPERADGVFIRFLGVFSGMMYDAILK